MTTRKSWWSSYSVSSLVRVALGLIVGAGFIYVVLLNIKLDEVAKILGGASIAPLVFAFIVYAIDFLLRAVRFWIMLLTTADRRLPLGPTISPYIASFGISDILPLRLGDGFRMVWFSRQFNISAGTVIGTMIVERILDLVTIITLGCVAMALLDVPAPPVLLKNFQFILAVGLVCGLGLLFAPALLHRVLGAVANRVNFKPLRMIVDALRETSKAVLQIGSFGRLLGLTLMSLALWVLESLVFVGVWISLGGTLDTSIKPFLAFVFSTLGTLVPSLPGHFGTFEYFGIQAFALTNVDATTAAAVVLLAHLVLWAPIALFGVIWLLVGMAPAKSRKI